MACSARSLYWCTCRRTRCLPEYNRCQSWSYYIRCFIDHCRRKKEDRPPFSTCCWNLLFLFRLTPSIICYWDRNFKEWWCVAQVKSTVNLTFLSWFFFQSSLRWQGSSVIFSYSSAHNARQESYHFSSEHRRLMHAGPTLLVASLNTFTVAVRLFVRSFVVVSFVIVLRPNRNRSYWGKPSFIWNDHGTNIIGATRELKEFISFFQKRKTQGFISEFCPMQNITWKFIPERTPHFGGLRESNEGAIETSDWGNETHFQRVFNGARGLSKQSPTRTTFLRRWYLLNHLFLVIFLLEGRWKFCLIVCVCVCVWEREREREREREEWECTSVCERKERSQRSLFSSV